MSSLDHQELSEITRRTVGHYDGRAASFWEGTRDHDVRQNIDALLRGIGGEGPHRILDFGCGPGRDLRALSELGHHPVGLDGAEAFCEMARAHSGCEVWHQDFLALDLPEARFEGVFANASLFHVPTQELPRVLGEQMIAAWLSGWFILGLGRLFFLGAGRLDENEPQGFVNEGFLSHVDDMAGAFRPETPAWSPDGSTLVYARRAIVDNVPQGAALVTTQWDLETQQFEDGAVMFLDVDAVEGRPFHDYPTWSPDSRWIVARASGSDLGTGQTPGDAEDFGFTLIDAESGEHRGLLNGAPAGFVYGRPSFSPFTEGGYFWLAFYADRPYGAVKPEGVKQIWVMAIDVDPTDGVDPSHPSFWLPGQSIDGINLSAFWARPTCAVEADTCGEDGECCVGLACVVDPETGAGTCQPSGCDLPGQFCDLKESTCCPGYSCQVSLSGVASCQPIVEGEE